MMMKRVKHHSVSTVNNKRDPSTYRGLTHKKDSLSYNEELMKKINNLPLTFTKLQRENLDLRKKLKELNNNLNALIEGSRMQKKKVNKEPALDELIETVRKKLKYYENESLKLVNRHDKLSDPNYETSLISKVSELEQKLLKCEEVVIRNEVKQKQRSKELNTVLDTGEKKELYQEFIELNTEIAIYTKKFHNLTNLNQTTLQSYKDTSQKIKEFENKHDKLKTQVDPSLLHDKENDRLIENSSKLKKVHDAIEGKYKSASQLLLLKIKKLEGELEDHKHQERALNEKIQAKGEEYKTYQQALNGLQYNVGSTKKILPNEYISDNLMFLTEKYHNAY